MKVIVFYGTECDDKTAWIPWLKMKLNEINIECIIPNLPTPENQTYKSWSEITKNVCIDRDDVIVAWSTGAIFSVRYLYEHHIKVKKLILVSGFNNYVGNVPSVDNINKNFFMKDVKVAKVVADKIVCIKSDNDPFISQQALNDFANELNAKTINVLGGGHFNTDSKYAEKFEEILKHI